MTAPVPELSFVRDDSYFDKDEMCRITDITSARVHADGRVELCWGGDLATLGDTAPPQVRRIQTRALEAHGRWLVLADPDWLIDLHERRIVAADRADEHLVRTLSPVPGTAAMARAATAWVLAALRCATGAAPTMPDPEGGFASTHPPAEGWPERRRTIDLGDGLRLTETITEPTERFPHGSASVHAQLRRDPAAPDDRLTISIEAKAETGRTHFGIRGPVPRYAAVRDLAERFAWAAQDPGWYSPTVTTAADA